MASVAAVISLLLIPLLLHSNTAASDFLTPLLSPLFDDVCKEVECGRGSCKSSPNSTFFFECHCDLGWKQTRSDQDHLFNFLPCIVPNCTLNSACLEAAPSVQQKSPRANESIFDPCRWADCGGGSCKKLSEFTYACECEKGYNNILNVSAFPCYRECAFGMDCANLGIALSNRSSSGTHALPDSGKNQAPGENGFWWVVLTMALALWM
ncbi:neurogenic locus notch homolog protein 2 [Carica papaya]|uniref:neurogenic locus notch homolog protein 2 n=1 Tax=Carica papaya TaxID=3649 RepID=UPI000B8D0074|nr:neurogenic locus notch homolog protein 2 [Carica papaya]